MFGSKKEGQVPSNPARIETVIGKDCELRGTITASGSVRIDGILQGEIINDGDLVVGEGAKVAAEVQARNVLLAGELRGNVKTQGKLELLPTAHLMGNIEVNHLVVADGAVFRGESKMVARDEQGEPEA